MKFLRRFMWRTSDISWRIDISYLYRGAPIYRFDAPRPDRAHGAGDRRHARRGQWSMESMAERAAERSEDRVAGKLADIILLNQDVPVYHSFTG